MLSFQNWVILFYKLITLDSESALKNTFRQKKTKKELENAIKGISRFPLYSVFSLYIKNSVQPQKTTFFGHN